MAKKGYNYFDAFVQMAQYSCEAAEYLVETLHNFDIHEMEERVTGLHEIENAADGKRHEITSHLIHEFITPIDREDIFSLVQQLDTAVDTIEDVLRNMYMHNITNMRPEAVEFSRLLEKCVKSMKTTMEKFTHFRKSSSIKDYIVEVNMLEEEGDRLHVSAVHDLFAAGGDPLEVIGWRKVYDSLEDCMDACEHVVDAVESVIMKNS